MQSLIASHRNRGISQQFNMYTILKWGTVQVEHIQSGTHLLDSFPYDWAIPVPEMEEMSYIFYWRLCATLTSMLLMMSLLSADMNETAYDMCYTVEEFCCLQIWSQEDHSDAFSNSSENNSLTCWSLLKKIKNKDHSDAFCNSSENNFSQKRLASFF